MTTEPVREMEVNDKEQDEDQNEQQGASSENGDQANETTEIVTESPEDKNPEESEPASVMQSPSSPVSPGQKSPGKQKGISRFLPPWLKKQKSYTVTEESEDGKSKAEELEVRTPTNVEEGKSESVKSGDQQEEKEKLSVSSAETQPAKEEHKEEELKVIEKEENEDLTNEVTASKPAETKKGSTLKSTKKVKTVPCKVILLDGTDYSCDLEKRAKGQVLFARVFEHLNLLETDYFGLMYRDNADQKNWLDPAKEIKRQIRNSPWLFVFNVKFYPPDPSQLTEDLTRYFLCLQLRQDISCGRLPCSFVTHALLGSYTLQAELGDYDVDEHSIDYISDFKFAPNQTKEMEDKVVELHKNHRGLTPAQADMQFLENAKKLSMYGVDLHHAKDSEAVDIMLGVCANGLLIYKDRLRINRFAWPKILKISYKRSNFYIKVRPGELEQFDSTIGFKLPNHRSAKRLWKVCVEHHTFYRLSSPEQPPKARFLTLGSKFRYSGRTQAQTREASIRIDRPAPHFERTTSNRVSRSLDGGKCKIPGIPVNRYQTCTGGRKKRSSVPHTPTKDQEASPGLILFYTTFAYDLDKSQDEILKHQASISELKRNFMESTPEPRPSEWEKRCIAPVSLQAHGSSDDIQNVVEEKKQPNANANERSVPEEVKLEVVNGELTKDPNADIAQVEETDKIEAESLSSESSSDSEDEEAEYKAENSRFSESVRKEELEEIAEEVVNESQEAEQRVVLVDDHMVTITYAHSEEVTTVISQEVTYETEEVYNDQEIHEEGKPKINGDVSHIDDASAQIICCSEPPVVKTEMVTISDATQRTEICTKEVPIVQTETKTITFESPQVDGGDSDPGMLLSAQTITSDSVLTTTTTHITKTGKGGISETRIEKRIVISGDADIDHDEALAQAIKEAKEQHPDMSITRVVVHKETEVTEEGEED
uniref:Erythrocyte membrane protein band 4.1 like 2 n=1 Tax=Leptobrachium leishanense TaxID=445787 RepID=A0A8C5MQP0_9ANUR